MSSNDTITSADQTLHLPDGRTLAYAIYGREGGKPLFYFHGHPGARVEAAGLAGPIGEAGVQLIAIDRPGMGLSSFQPGRRLLDWPADVVAVADHLHLDRFAVFGASGGGPYALACAYRIPDRLTACGVACGIGPLDLGTAGMMRNYRLALFLALRFPWLLTPLLWAFGLPYRNEDTARKAIVKSAQHMSEPDRLSLLVPEVSAAVAASTMEAFRQGTRGVIYEASLYARPWGFRLEDIACPRIFLWHGGRDRIVPVAMGRAVAARLAHCQATFYPDEGHFSVLVNHISEMISTLIANS